MTGDSWLLDDEGDLDDVTVHDIQTLRIERMDANSWWMSITKDGKTIHLDLNPSSSGFILTKRED